MASQTPTGSRDSWLSNEAIVSYIPPLYIYIYIYSTPRFEREWHVNPGEIRESIKDHSRIFPQTGNNSDDNREEVKFSERRRVDTRMLDSSFGRGLIIFR